MSANFSRMQEMAAMGADWWNDSGVPDEVAQAVAHGASGGTSNPVIVSQAVKAHPALCHPIIDRLIADHPAMTEDQIAWELIHALARDSAAKLRPVYDRTGGAKGFLSVQVNPKFYRSRDEMVRQGTQLATLAPNIAVKLPATEAGIAAMEELTARHVTVNATVSFAVAQAVAVAAALERGLARSGAGARDRLHPYITIMVGRVDDQLRRVAEAEKLPVDARDIEWAGIAVFKEAHRIFRERGFPGTLLAAAYRHEGHWTQLLGPEVLQTIPYSWWKKFDTSPTTLRPSLSTPVDPGIVRRLRDQFPDFARAYDEHGMRAEEFLHFGATRHTLAQFLAGYDDLVAAVRARMLQP